MRRITMILLAAALLQGCAHQKTGNQCEDNFNTEGGFIAGKTFTSNVQLDMPYAKVFDRAQKTLVKEGFTIQTADEKSGTISAYQGVILSSRNAPLNIVVEKAGSGSKVSYVFVTLGGMYTTEGAVRDGFCRFTDGIRQ
ncbi:MULTISPECIES: hypothetical protein [Pseudomonas]|uniref:Lipoprotein n=1 Tax=Pseudomonas multiresinivorans TaxID=95301 RepID=A0A7Z3BM03_9PSED|nr:MULTISPECIES: hypothetical protein [Pseudomonas]MCE4072547.1 hypothetical protein [Pseudomonas nitritireducens]MCE4081589.1 hypothetical protein [Pseudomonas nitroreducens]QJP09381.1 hypothetical protein G4G71_16380 [Pseudomonas multiresinivorans]